MDVSPHLLLCRPGTPYFDVPSGTDGRDGDFPLAHAEPPAGWVHDVGAEWVARRPAAPPLPAQGWKVHVSATPDSAARVLEAAAGYCTANGVAFKFLRGIELLVRRNGKYGDRSASGKFVTVYPVDDAHLGRVLDELGDLLDGEPGPYVLSDLRWRSGPLYVRYGGFVARTVVTGTGERELAISDPDGTLVPDRRGPGFRPPPWVELPAFLADAAAARAAGTLHDFPYRVTGALHFSNGGGVYRGVDTRSGADVLLREARPLAGLDANGHDAVVRHEREQWALERLAGEPGIPRFLETRTGHEHRFLVREYVEGVALSVEMLRRNPIVRGTADHAAYTVWACGVLDRVEHGVRRMHARGVVYGDLHPGNVLVRPDGDVAFVDFETATPAGSAETQLMGAPGFTAPPQRRGTAVDRYALGCLRLAVFAPLTAVLPWGAGKAEQLLELVTRHFPVPAGYAAAVRRDLDLDPGPGTADPIPHLLDPAGWPALCLAVADGILAAATPRRTDRLFPGDAEQFAGAAGGVDLATGAAGVLWALAEAGVVAPAAHVDWLLGATRAVETPRPGFFRGLAGVAFALDRLGRLADAREVLDRIDAAAPLGHDLLDGLAGIGLAQLHLGRSNGDRDLLAAALRTADRLADAPPTPESASRAGLLLGASGGALLHLRLYEEAGDAGLLDLAERAVRLDLDRLGLGGSDPLPAGTPGRAPLFATGCAGVGMVLHDLLAHRPDPGLARVRDAIRTAVAQPFHLQAGLFHGRAGAVVALAHLSEGHPSEGAAAEALRDHAAGFALHAVRHDGRPAFLGRDGLRISTDLATGGAGVLLALDAAAGGGPGLPFFGRTTRRAS